MAWRLVCAGALCVSAAPSALAHIEITEWMYQGVNGEFVEITNLGGTPVDLAGWSFDDDSRTPGVIDLSAIGVLAPGASALITDAVAADFTLAWGLVGVPVIGGSSAGLARNDEINIFDAAGVLADRLTYGDQNFPGTVRTQNRACNIPFADLAFTTAQTSWTLASAGDAFGSFTSTGGDVGSPGVTPAPGVLGVAAGGMVLALRRRR